VFNRTVSCLLRHLRKNVGELTDLNDTLRVHLSDDLLRNGEGAVNLAIVEGAVPHPVRSSIHETDDLYERERPFRRMRCRVHGLTRNPAHRQVLAGWNRNLSVLADRWRQYFEWCRREDGGLIARLLRIRELGQRAVRVGIRALEGHAIVGLRLILIVREHALLL